VRVRGDAIFPTSFGGLFSILFTILRQLSLVLSIAVLSSELKTIAPDVVIVDQLSACIPFFRFLYPKAKILFYGHFPDRLLVQEPKGMAKYAKRAYRLPFDAFEAWSTSCSDDIVVNSKFTRAVFKGTFPDMRQREMKVIYPCVNTSGTRPTDSSPPWPGKKLLLSINRFEGKKNLGLAIRAYAGLSADERSRAKLLIAGGYDPRSIENASVHKELQGLAESQDMKHATFRSNDTLTTDMTTDDVDIIFLLSIPNELKQRLLFTSSLLVYTPKNEHFGIVPLEAMLAGVPVLATNTGGPLETIYDGRTGWLRSPDKIEQWTDVMRKAVIPSSESTLKAMGQRGRERILSEFSHTKMTQQFDKEIQALCASDGRRPSIWPQWLLAFLVMAAIAIPAGILAMYVMLWAVNLDEKKHLAEVASSSSSLVASASSRATHEL
jgi:alpha-1,3/alpha-1,6-mannosyltransferase